MTQLKTRLLFFLAILTCLILMAGCGNYEERLTINKDGTVTFSETIEPQQLVYDLGRKELNKWRQDRFDNGFGIKDTEKGFISSKTLPNIQDLANLGFFERTEVAGNKGVLYRKGFLYDSYVLDGYMVSRAENLLYFNSNRPEDMILRNNFENNAKINFTINLPYKADSSNATSVTDEGKTLSWDLKKVLLGGSLQMTTQFRLYHENTLIMLGVIGCILLITGIVGTIFWFRNRRTASKSFYLSIAIISFSVLVGLGGYVGYALTTPPVLTDADWVKPTKKENMNFPSPVSDADLQKANEIIASKNLPYKISAVSSFDNEGFLGFLGDKGMALIVYDKKSDTVAMVEYKKEILKPRSQKYSSTLTSTLTRYNDTKDSPDKDAGYWSGANHYIPFYAHYSISPDRQVIVEKDKTSTGRGASPSHYHSPLRDPINKELVNIALTHGLSLAKDMKARKISI